MIIHSDLFQISYIHHCPPCYLLLVEVDDDTSGDLAVLQLLHRLVELRKSDYGRLQVQLPASGKVESLVDICHAGDERAPDGLVLERQLRGIDVHVELPSGR